MIIGKFGCCEVGGSLTMQDPYEIIDQVGVKNIIVFLPFNPKLRVVDLVQISDGSRDCVFILTVSRPLM